MNLPPNKFWLCSRLFVNFVQIFYSSIKPYVMSSLMYEARVLLFVTLCFSIECRKEIRNNPTTNGSPATQTVGNLEFILETTDMNGNFKSQFAEGENFMLTLMIKNNNAKGVTLCHCFLTDTNPDLFAVYTAEPTASKYGTMAAGDSVGQPWNAAGGIDIAPITGIGANSFIKYTLPWFISDTTVKYFAPVSPPVEAFHVVQNSMLPVGMYYTQFRLSYLNSPVYLKFYFEVY